MKDDFLSLCFQALDKGVRVVIRKNFYLKKWCNEIKAIEVYGENFSSETLSREQATKLFNKYSEVLHFE